MSEVALHMGRGELTAEFPGRRGYVLEGFKNVSRFRDETRSENSPKNLATLEGNRELGSLCPHFNAPENSNLGGGGGAGGALHVGAEPFGRCLPVGYRDTSLMRNCLLPGPYSRTMPRALRLSSMKIVSHWQVEHYLWEQNVLGDTFLRGKMDPNGSDSSLPHH